MSAEFIDLTPANWQLAQELFDTVMRSTEVQGMARFSYQVLPDEDWDSEDLNDPECHWHIYIYEQYTELMRGKHDGQKVFEGGSTCLDQLLKMLEPIEYVPQLAFSFNWNSPEDPCVTVTGKYKGREVTVTILSQPPADAEVGIGLYPDMTFEERS